MASHTQRAPENNMQTEKRIIWAISWGNLLKLTTKEKVHMVKEML